MNVQFHKLITNNINNLHSIIVTGLLIDFGVKSCRVKILQNPYKPYKIGSIISVKTDLLKFIN